jgi:putative redox protein
MAEPEIGKPAAQPSADGFDGPTDSGTAKARPLPPGQPLGYGIEVQWQGGKRFLGGRQGGPGVIVDGDRVAGPGAVDTLLVALASCSAMDVVAYLEKRRTPAVNLRVQVEAERAIKPPRRLTAVRLRFVIDADAELEHARRAIALAVEKYCSVASSLDPALPIAWEMELRPAGAARP